MTTHARTLPISPSIFKPASDRDPHKINELLKERSLWLHKAGSVRYKAKGMTVNKRNEIIDGCNKEAGKVFKELIDEIVDQFPDTRPEQSPGFTFNGVEYVLQSFDGSSSKYIEKSKFDPDKYHYNQEPYKAYIIRHFARSTVITNIKED